LPRLKQEIRVIPVKVDRDIMPGDRLYNLILQSAVSQGVKLTDGDVVIIAQKIVSKAEGQIVPLGSLEPSDLALSLARASGKDPRLIELVLRQSKSIVKISNGIIIAETKHGFVCANAGIDQSNIINSDENALLLPENPDASAKQIMDKLKEKTNRDIAVIVTDSFGRPFRNGQANVAIGVAGLNPLKSYIGEKDMYGKILRVTEIAVADELASAAELVMGKSACVPIAIVRGYNYEKSKEASVDDLIRVKEKDLFR
jgi:coenzyme F420-0:L-glutamate ligase/coenzyme F420-1:gamma-L-glutamate ligase